MNKARRRGQKARALARRRPRPMVLHCPILRYSTVENAKWSIAHHMMSTRGLGLGWGNLLGEGVTL